MLSVLKYIEREYMKKRKMKKTRAVMAFCQDFGITYPTGYSWIKDQSISVSVVKTKSGETHSINKQIAAVERVKN